MEDFEMEIEINDVSISFPVNFEEEGIEVSHGDIANVVEVYIDYLNSIEYDIIDSLSDIKELFIVKNAHEIAYEFYVADGIMVYAEYDDLEVTKSDESIVR